MYECVCVDRMYLMFFVCIVCCPLSFYFCVSKFGASTVAENKYFQSIQEHTQEGEALEDIEPILDIPDVTGCGDVHIVADKQIWFAGQIS